MAEKKCKYCSLMIPKDAKICPHCRKKQGIGFLGKIFLVFFIIVVFGAIMASLEEKPSKSSPSPARQETTLTAVGQAIKNTHPFWSNNICNAIGEKKIFIGMTKDQVVAAWGKPYKINTTTGSYGTHEQWVMHDSINSSYIYFENDILTTIQQSQ